MYQIPLTINSIQEYYQALTSCKKEDRLTRIYIKIITKLTLNTVFGLFKFNSFDEEVRTVPGSPHTLESLKMEEYRRSLVKQMLKPDKPCVLVNGCSAIPFLSGKICAGFVLVKGQLTPEIIQLISHISQIWMRQRDYLELQHDNGRLASELGRSLHNLSVVRSIAHSVSKANDLNHLLTLILRVAITTVNAARGFIMLESDNGRELELKVAQGLPNKDAERKINAGILKPAKIPLGEGIQGRVMQTLEPVIVNRTMVEEETIFGIEGGNSVMCVPLVMHETAFGVIYLTSKESEEPFDKEDLDVITILAAHASAVLDQARLYTLATTDELTGLYTRRFYSQKIGDESKRAMRYNRHLSMLVLDIDFFKKTNDKFGHEAGDFVLKRVAKLMESLIRTDIDMAVRFGGEEFVLVLPETHLQGAKIVADRVRSLIEEEKIIFHDKEIPTTISIGVSSYPENGASIHDLFQLADQALYSSKSKGRNCVTTFPEL